MQERPMDSTAGELQRRAALAVLAAAMVSACATARPAAAPTTAALTPASADSAGLLIECARRETARLGYRPVSNQARSAAAYYDVDHPDDGRWFVTERTGPATGYVVIVAEARRDAAGNLGLLATALQLDNSRLLIARESTTPIRRSIAGASTHGTKPAPAALAPEVRGDLALLRNACASPPPGTVSNDGPQASR